MQVVEDEHERLGVGDVAGGRSRSRRRGGSGAPSGSSDTGGPTSGRSSRSSGASARRRPRRLPAARARPPILAAHVRPDRLRPRPVGRRTAGFPGAAEEGRRAALARLRRELVREPALADARLAGEQDEAAASSERPSSACWRTPSSRSRPTSVRSGVSAVAGRSRRRPGGGSRAPGPAARGPARSPAPRRARGARPGTRRAPLACRPER